jgi:hypothetical protein
MREDCRAHHDVRAVPVGRVRQPADVDAAAEAEAAGVAVGPAVDAVEPQALATSVTTGRAMARDEFRARGSPVGTDKRVERETGFEPATCSLEGCRSAS